MTRNAYITAMGVFLPGEPIANDQMEDYLGLIGGNRSRTRDRILKSNQIQSRHYAIDRDQKARYKNSEMAAFAVREALKNSSTSLDSIDLLACATSVPDVIVPGFASMVHGELKNPPCEVVSVGGVCASSVMAIKNAFLMVQSGEKKNAVACGSEFTSRFFRSTRFESQAKIKAEGQTPFDTDFLRWMLSDGAGAMVIQDRPAPRGLSFRIEWIDLKSHADRFDVCMFMGGEKDPETGKLKRGWLEYKDESEAAELGAFNLTQDIRMLDDVVKIGVAHLFELMDKGRVDTDALDWMICHYSSHFFKGKIHEFLSKAGIRIPEEKWFTNLYTRGNTGAASIFIMLEEFLRTQPVKAGQKILCQVPESGRFISAYMMLTAVDATDAPAVVTATAPAEASARPAQAQSALPEAADLAPAMVAAPQAPAFSEPRNPMMEKMIRQLSQVWIDFETKMNRVPIIDKMNRGKMTIEDYRHLVLNIRQQVVDGALWLSRMVSNISIDLFPVRSFFLDHALYGHKDYQMLDHDYVAVGGNPEDLKNAQKNIGSEALSAWIFQRASHENPLDILGAMYVIEGISSRLAPRWSERIAAQLGLRPDQMTFLVHHAKHKDAHVTGPIEDLLNSPFLTEERLKQIIKTAKVTARLYLLQLEELDHF